MSGPIHYMSAEDAAESVDARTRGKIPNDKGNSKLNDDSKVPAMEDSLNERFSLERPQ